MTTLHLHNVAAQGSKPQYLWRVVSIGAALLLATLTTWSPAHAETVPASGSTGSAESSLQPDEVDPRARDIWTPSVSTADLVMNISQMDGIAVERQDRDFEIHALPDTEVILSPTTIHFNIAEFVSTQGGFLERYREKVSGT